MTRQHLSVILMVSAGLVFTFSCTKKPAAPSQSDPVEMAKSAQKLPGPAQLPDFVERRGMVSKRFESIRLYVLVNPEIPIQRAVEGEDRIVILDRVPIRVVLENETYRALTPLEAQITNSELYAVTVSKLDSNEEVFTYHQLTSELSAWTPAERKTFNIDWPLSAPVPGAYLITLTPGFGDKSPLQIRTTLK